jgi:DNA gyrase subunit A
MGVKGVNTDGGEVIGMATSEEGSNILTITENGFGKKSPLAEYRMTSRGTKGVKAMNVTMKTGNLVCLKAVNGDEDCMIMTDDGIIIRITLNQVSQLSRNSQGVRVIKTAENSKVSTVAIVDPDSEETDETAPAETEAAAENPQDASAAADTPETADTVVTESEEQE